MSALSAYNYCPTCDARTIHVRARPVGAVGVSTYCRECTDVEARIEAGEMEAGR
jgi:hypothetical protein